MKNNLPLAEDGIMLSSQVVMELIQAVHEKGASFRFKARGFSMAPSIRDGDVITISPLKNIPPRRGDVLAFRDSERSKMLVHRVLRINDTVFLMGGDNCLNPDGWIPFENILGVVTRVERNGKSLFWPARLSFSGNLFLFLYVRWLSLRKFLMRRFRSMKQRIR